MSCVTVRTCRFEKRKFLLGSVVNTDNEETLSFELLIFNEANLRFSGHLHKPMLLLTKKTQTHLINMPDPDRSSNKGT
jgi:hypothetical protein